MYKKVFCCGSVHTYARFFSPFRLTFHTSTAFLTTKTRFQKRFPSEDFLYKAGLHHILLTLCMLCKGCYRRIYRFSVFMWTGETIQMRNMWSRIIFWKQRKKIFIFISIRISVDRAYRLFSPYKFSLPSSDVRFPQIYCYKRKCSYFFTHCSFLHLFPLVVSFSYLQSLRKS